MYVDASPPPVDPPSAGTVPAAPAASVIQEQRGLLARLFKR
jgi:hypothetical protein